MGVDARFGELNMRTKNGLLTKNGLFLCAFFLLEACASSPKPVAQIAPSGGEASLQFSRDARSTMSVLPATQALEARKELQKRKELSIELMASVAELGLIAGHFDEAAEQARGVIKMDFKNAEGMKTLLKVYIFSRRPQEALLLADNALQVQPRDPDVIGLKGLAYYYLNDPFAARDQWRKALEVNPGHVPSQMSLAVLYFQNRNISQAGIGFERVLAIQPSNTDAQIGKALVLDVQGQSVQARERLEKIAADNPRAALVHYNLAVIERDRFENYEKALTHMDAYLKVAPKERTTMERALGMREELRSLIAKKKLNKLSDDELRQLAKKSSQAREQQKAAVSNSPAAVPANAPANAPVSASVNASPADPLTVAPKVEHQKPLGTGDDVESLEDAIR